MPQRARQWKEEYQSFSAPVGAQFLLLSSDPSLLSGVVWGYSVCMGTSQIRKNALKERRRDTGDMIRTQRVWSLGHGHCSEHDNVQS